ncbi:hypothetical protein EVAR_94546_1 [Eumeta japonica]|uniref:EGF-like domain-containing protein n=1 Tax=Eumeta variegata TaxID=151549 RepID=A0A4C1UW37_EUMVA|nr:hypothetical protein EVAR_94546_1 [Eumeta japonica]
MALSFVGLAITIALSVVHFTRCENIPSCNDMLLEPCPGDNIVCNEHVCVCEAGFSWDGEECTVPNTVPDSVPDSASTQSHGATLVVALLLRSIRKNTKKIERLHITCRWNGEPKKIPSTTYKQRDRREAAAAGQDGSSILLFHDRGDGRRHVVLTKQDRHRADQGGGARPQSSTSHQGNARAQRRRINYEAGSRCPMNLPAK